MCFPTRGSRVRLWSIVAPVQPVAVWQSPHDVPSRPSWISLDAWQLTHVVGAARRAARVVAPEWQPAHAASWCLPVSG